MGQPQRPLTLPLHTTLVEALFLLWAISFGASSAVTFYQLCILFMLPWSKEKAISVVILGACRGGPASLMGLPGCVLAWNGLGFAGGWQ